MILEALVVAPVVAPVVARQGTLVPAESSPPELDLGYQVAIDAFSGPMDLLLYLVRQAQVDIADIPIATIADQFVATIAEWAHVDLDTAGDFILMAATLLEIKSRLVAPPREESAEGDIDDDGFDFDPRAGLIQQLLAYRLFKDATPILDHLEAQAQRACLRVLRETIPEEGDELDGLNLENANAGALYDAFAIIQQRIAGLGPRTVIYDDEPMEARMATVATAVQAAGTVQLSDLWRPLGHRVQRAGMLVAVLECTRQRLVRIDQFEQFGAVLLHFRPEDQRAIAEGMPAAPDEPVQRRRRRPPLMTFHAEDLAPLAEVSDAEQAEEEAVVETDEQRFLRELEESCQLEAVLERGRDLEAGFAAFIAAQKAATDDGHVDADPALAELEATSAGDQPPAIDETTAVDDFDDGGPRRTPGRMGM